MQTPNENNKRKYYLMWLVLILACLMWLVFLASCTRTIYQPAPEYHEIHDTVVKKEVVEKEVIKEVTVRDSVSLVQKGDTIRIERWHYERDYSREKALQAKIDSLSHVQRDTIIKPYPVEVPIPREYTLKERVLFKFAGFGIFCLFLILLYIAYRMVKNKITRHK